MKTKILGLLLTLVVAVTSLPAGTTAYAAENETVEVQQEQSAEALGATEAEIKAGAVALTSGVARVDSIAANKAVNWYKFTVPKTGGYVNYSLSKIDADSDGMWSVEWFFENVTDGQFWNLNYSTYDSGKLTLAAGTWYIKVSGDLEVDYKFMATFTTDSAYESEGNDTIGTANVLTSGKICYGQVNGRYDVCDWYKLTTNKKGYFMVDLSKVNALEASASGWNMYVYNDKSDLLYKSVYSEKTMKSCKIPCDQGNYYIKIEYANFYSSDEFYALKVTSYVATTMEAEKNDTYKTANTIKTGVAYTGALQCAEDEEDWYKFKLTNPGTVFLKFSRRNYALPEDLGDGWMISIYKGTSATPIQTLDTKDTATYKMNLKKGTYYVRIYMEWGEKPINQDYSIKVNYAKTPKTVKLKSVTAGKRRATIKWNKSNDATGYYIYRSTAKNGRYKKIATIKKNKTVKYVDKKSLKSNRTYYYKVVAYKKTNGLTATSNMSKYKAVKIK